MEILYLKQPGFNLYFKVIDEALAVRVSVSKFADGVIYIKEKPVIKEIVSNFAKISKEEFEQAFNPTICEISNVHNVTDAICK